MNTVAPDTIRALRLRRGLTYDELARRVSEISGKQVSHRAPVMWERRGVSNGRLEEALAKALGVSIAAIREASAESRRDPGPALPRGPRRKITV